MYKRSYDDQHDAANKRQKNSNNYHQHRNHHQPHHRTSHDNPPQDRSPYTTDHKKALSSLPPSTTTPSAVPAYTPFTVPPSLPILPQIRDPILAAAPFLHKSAHPGYDRSSTVTDLTYERLEFLGDAYLELFATRLIFHHFPTLPTGAQSQVREALVKNETLAEYSRAYGFEHRVRAEGLEGMEEEARGRGNKGLNKILGDVLEAYIAAVVLDDAENGFAQAEKWLTALWAPKVLDAARAQRHAPAVPYLHTAPDADPKSIYNPTAKAELQKRIVGQDVKLSYEPYRESVELKGDQLGQNRHFVAVYLTGHGYERKLLGKGEGKNKVEAGNWAAGDAMVGESKGIVEECERKVTEVRERKKREREAREAAKGAKEG